MHSLTKLGFKKIDVVKYGLNPEHYPNIRVGFGSRKEIGQTLERQRPFIIGKVKEQLSKKEYKEFLRKNINFTGATVLKNPKTVILSKKIDPNQPGLMRNYLEHERFHLKPIVGNSEILAHSFGGYKELPKDTNIMKKLHYAAAYPILGAAARPDRFALEAAVAVGAGVGVSKLLKGKTSG